MICGLNDLYLHLPIPLQTLWLNAGSLVFSNLRHGRSFRQVLSQLEEMQWWSSEQLAAFQNQALQQLLDRASRVPFYRPYLADANSRVLSSSPTDLLSRMPILTKFDLIERGDRLIDPSVARWRLNTGYSSGTTGSPLKVYRDLRSIVFENAIIWRQWRWAGFREADRRVTLRGDIVIPISQRKPPFWRYNAVDRQLLMSSYHLSEATAASYIQQVREFRPHAIQSYPSTAYLLARFALDRGVRDIRPKAVFTSSEVVLDHQREVITEAFRCPIYDWYGTAERVSAIGTCEEGTYHIFPEYGLTELLPVENRSECSRLLGTPFHNLAMPIIRYDAQDLVVPGTSSCACGRSFPSVKHIEGRYDDYVVTPDGRFIGRLDHVFKYSEHITEAQIVQESPSEITVRIVTGPGYTSADSDKVRHNLLERTDPSIQVKIDLVQSITRTKNGKFRAVISHCTEQRSYAPDADAPD